MFSLWPLYKLVVQLGIIGYRNQAERLITLAETNPKCNLKYIFHPNKKISDKRVTNNLNDLFSCDAIIISSPNSTHYEYIKKLSHYSGYVFCEKPPVTTFEELKKLKKLNENKKRKIFFNFNYRFSELNNILKQLKAIVLLIILLYLSFVKFLYIISL